MEGSIKVETENLLKKLKFNDSGLIVAVAQDYITNDVLMVAYMNKESIEITLKEKRVCYFSRSRNCLWRKRRHVRPCSIFKRFCLRL